MSNLEEPPVVYVACEICGGEAAILKYILVYEHGCGFGHDDVASDLCPHCCGTGGMICEAEGDYVA